MKIKVLFAQRQENYEGEYGLEALACMSEHEFEENPDYLKDQLKSHEQQGDFSALSVIEMEVDEASIRAIMFPAHVVIPAVVVPPVVD